MPIDLICLDADDTLWHNMRFFDATEQALIDMLRPFGNANVARETLEVCEARNLKLYGYGAKGFTLSMVETAVELGGDTIPAKLISDILDAGRALLAHPVELLDDVENTLDALAAHGRLVLVTKGDLLHQESKLAASGLGDRFAGIEIVSDKTPDTFRQLFARYEVEPVRAVMAAGAWAAFVPQALAWSHESAPLPEEHPRFRQLASLSELPGWIHTIS
jgi:putative hydrolase of the HAD superfamily